MLVVFGLLLVLCGPASAVKDLVLQLDLPPADILGSHAGSERIAITEVTDGVFADTPVMLGMGPQATYLLVRTLVGEYSYPEDLEVCFDDIAYPL